MRLENTWTILYHDHPIVSTTTAVNDTCSTHVCTGQERPILPVNGGRGWEERASLSHTPRWAHRVILNVDWRGNFTWRYIHLHINKPDMTPVSSGDWEFLNQITTEMFTCSELARHAWYVLEKTLGFSYFPWRIALLRSESNSHNFITALFILCECIYTVNGNFILFIVQDKAGWVGTECRVW